MAAGICQSGEPIMSRTAAATLLLLASIPAFSQGSSTPLSFEVADVKINKSGSQEMFADLQNGRVSVRNAPMKLLITAAWHIPPDALEGGPRWIEIDRFDVVAKAAASASEDELRLMLRTLLIERFKLTVHTDQKAMPAYVMTVGKGGPKLQQSEAAKPGEQRCGTGEGTPGDAHVACKHATMADLAEALPQLAGGYFRGTPVVDQTELKGSYDFKLDWTPAARYNLATRGDAPAGETAGVRSVFEAVEAQLGLKLESKKTSLPIIVIDHVERVPTEN
jgi:uncharacterized protein (TIGR03435 family)